MLEEVVPLQIEVVLLHPLALHLPLKVLLKSCVLDTGIPVEHDVEEAQHEGTLAHSVGDWLHQIPAQPLHVEDAVVTNEELCCEEARHAKVQGVSLSGLFCLDLLHLLVKDIKLSSCLCLLETQIEYLLSHHGILEEGRLLDEQIGDLIDSDSSIVC